MKKNLLKWIVLPALILIAGQVFGQVDRIQQAMADSNYKRALKLVEDAKEESDLRKNPHVYYLEAEILYELMKDEYYLKRNPEAFDMGIKAIVKGKSKDEDNEVIKEYKKVIDNYVQLNNDVANGYYRVNKYGKAMRTYELSYELNGDWSAYFWEGKCALYDTDTSKAHQHYNQVIHWYSEKYAEEGSNKGMTDEPFIYFADYYWRQQRYDSANYFLLQARKIFGPNDQINYYQREVAKEQILQLPPSTLMMEVIKNNLVYFPKDTFLLRKQNALYLYQIRNAIEAHDTALTDTLLNHLAGDKLQRSKTPDSKYYSKNDYFYDDKKENVWWKVCEYLYNNNHDNAGNFLARKYIIATADTTTQEAIEERWLVIIDFTAKKKSLAFAGNLLNVARAEYPESTGLKEMRSELIQRYGEQELETADLGALYRLLAWEVKENTSSEIQNLYHIKSVDYVDALIRDKDYVTARKEINRMQMADPGDLTWTRKESFLAREEFFYGYYMTRIQEEEVAGMTIPGFEWNGDMVKCEPGNIDPSIQQKVQDRVNYFRRAAGVPEIFLDPELNDWCQKAALMMEANQKLDHEPDARWRCYTQEGATAAYYSVLAQGVNTSQAVTSFFADNSNPSVGNRRWMLYPNSKSLGHGSTNNFAVVWALDDSGNVDSGTYKEQFIAWPPEGYIPSMMVFDYWSFTLDQDLKGATVTLMEGDKKVPFEMQELVDGYGLPTLVWKPEENISDSGGKRVIEVTVALKNGRKYKYTVNVFKFDPVGY